MSYCRFSNADVYIYEAKDGFTCCGCRLAESGMFICDTELEMVEHIRQHRKEGHFIPEYVDRMLIKEWNDMLSTIETELQVKLTAKTYLEDILIRENSLGRYYDEMDESESAELKKEIKERIDWIIARVLPIDEDKEGDECL